MVSIKSSAGTMKEYRAASKARKDAIFYTLLRQGRRIPAIHDEKKLLGITVKQAAPILQQFSASELQTFLQKKVDAEDEHLDYLLKHISTLATEVRESLVSNLSNQQFDILKQHVKLHAADAFAQNLLLAMLETNPSLIEDDWSIDIKDAIDADINGIVQSRSSMVALEEVLRRLGTLDSKTSSRPKGAFMTPQAEYLPFGSKKRKHRALPKFSIEELRFY